MTESNKGLPISLKGITSTNDDPSRCAVCMEPFVGPYQSISAVHVCCGKRVCRDCIRAVAAFDKKRDRCLLCGLSGTTSFGLLKKKAKQGYPWAQEELGRQLTIKKDAKRSAHEAVRWFRKAAAKGHPMAIIYLADMLSKGSGCQQDLSLARNILERAIAMHATVAEEARKMMVNVAVFCGENGDFKTAVSILTPLVELGVGRARLNLGTVYSRNDEREKALELYWENLEADVDVGLSSYDAMTCSNRLRNWPQAKFWLSNSTKNLREILVATDGDSKVLCAIHDMRLDLRKIRDTCGGCGAELHGKMRKKCAGCKTFCYCNRDCQKLHWNCKKDGHREDCKKVMELKTKIKEARKAKDKTAEK